MLQQIDNAVAFAVVMLMLSLIVTAIVQVISALADLRGRNLALGLKNLLDQIEPELRKPLGGSTIAQHIAEVVVKHPAVAHAGTRAKAISQSELIRVLRDLCSENPAATIDGTVKTKLKQLLDDRVPGGAETVAAVQVLAQQLGAKLPGQEAQVKAAIDATFATVPRLEYQVGQWFDTIMESRLSDIFTRKTRVITVAISVLFVLALQIDSSEILRQIAGNPELRARLTNMTDPALSQARKIFDNAERAKAALADVKNNHTNKGTDQDKQIVAALDKAPIDLSSCIAGKRWFAENATKIPTAASVQKEFDDACQKRTLQAAGDSYEEIAEIRADLENTDLKFVPTVIGGQTVFDSWAHWWAAFGVRRHLAGILASIVFLSLGAPFWFNTLRQLSNLRPAIAGKVGRTKRKGDSGKTSGAN
jgi:hypothetical protein